MEGASMDMSMYVFTVTSRSLIIGFLAILRCVFPIIY